MVVLFSVLVAGDAAGTTVFSSLLTRREERGTG